MSGAPFDARLREATRFADLVHVAVCESTQDVAGSLQGNAIVWADEQEAGRGRLGRSWHGDPGRDVEVTLRVEGLDLDEPSILAAAVPVAVAEALQGFTERRVRLEWPNDVLCDGRKLSGVLIDANGNPPSTFLIGIGVNVNRTSFPPELMDSATSLALLTGTTQDRERVLFEIARSIEVALTELSGGETERLDGAFRQRLALVGRIVKVVEAGEEITGRLTDIDLRRAVVDGRTVRLALSRSLERA